MKKLLVLIIATVTIGMATPAPVAQAHFMRGGNCHIESISRNGTIQMRFTNRTYNWLRVRCILDFNYGRNGYMWRDVAPRSWAIGRYRFFGQWTRVWVIHVHTTRL